MRSLLLLCCVIEIYGIDFSLNETAHVTLGVMEKQHTACLYTLYSPHWSKNANLEYVKLLAKLRSIQIAVVAMSSLTEVFNRSKCSENLPLYLLMHNDGPTQEDLKKISRSILLRARWLQFFPVNTSLDEFFRDIFVPYDCEFSALQHVNGGFVLTEVYKHSMEQVLQKHVVANWRNHNFVWTNLTMLQRRNDLQGDEEALKMKCENMNNNFCKILLEIWSILEHKMNFCSRAVAEWLGQNVLVQNDGAYAGWSLHWENFFLMEFRPADVGVNIYGMTTERKEFVNYVSVAFLNRISLFIKKNGSRMSRFGHILQPFSSGFWLTILLFLLVLTSVLSLTWFHKTTPSALSSRVVYLTAYLTFMIIFTAYSATFISILTVHRNTLPFTHYQGLIHIDTYQCGVPAASIFLSIFEDATDPVFQEVYKKMLAPKLKSLPKSVDEGFHRVCDQENYAFVADAEDINFNDCELVAVPGTDIYLPCSFIINKHSPYNRILSHHLENLRRTGILKKIKIAMRESPDENKDSELSNLAATMEDTLPIFIILLCGGLVAILCLVVENVYFYISSKSLTN
ncbi:hypothetical protein L9F63_002621 [Diploptera punctata]|uniref:Uncharacterized protein n=1 Tax=Diploptera punctata TaxID=6984 RepID=A0AAD7ZRY8_DIPPU|nr:hypothetical protein L9F63_002621 [Diploptera punctata]